MKIATSALSLNNDYRQKSDSTRQVSVIKPAISESSGKAKANTQVIGAAQAARNAQTTVELSTQLNAKLSNSKGLLPQPADVKSKKDPTSDELDGSKYYEKGLYVMKMLLEQMMGKSIELFDANRFMAQRDQTEQTDLAMLDPNDPAAVNQINPNNNGNDLMMIKTHQYEYESNRLEFSGVYQQQSGKESAFSFALSFSQEYESTTTLEMKREQMKDPLVISFSTNPVQLSNKRFEFDIDNDQQKDSIAMLESGYGFLAIDRNSDQKINDGSELFGALNGDGFAELAQYDQDQNGFIDENDSIFNSLSVWIKNEGEDKLVSLKSTGIGAIALQNVDTPLNIRDQDEKLGVIRKSGFYLNENGSAGLIQQLDYVV